MSRATPSGLMGPFWKFSPIARVFAPPRVVNSLQSARGPSIPGYSASTCSKNNGLHDVFYPSSKRYFISEARGFPPGPTASASTLWQHSPGSKDFHTSAQTPTRLNYWRQFQQARCYNKDSRRVTPGNNNKTSSESPHEVSTKNSGKNETTNPDPKINSNTAPGTTEQSPEAESLTSSMSKYLHLPRMPHRPTKEELLAAATNFRERLRVRFKWMSIRSMRPWNVDEWGAFISWFMLGHLVWILVGTTTFFSLIILSINTVFAQGKFVCQNSCGAQHLAHILILLDRNPCAVDWRLSNAVGWC